MGASPAGFDDAFPALYRQARTVAWRLLGNREDAEDAAAEALARALLAWHKIEALPYREAWVSRVAANVAIDALRRRRRRLTLNSADVPRSAEPDPGEAVPLGLDVRAGLARLPRRQAEVLVLRWIAGLNEGQVAAALGLSRSSVRTHAARGLAAMQQQLGGAFEYVAL